MGETEFFMLVPLQKQGSNYCYRNWVLLFVI